MLCFLGNQQSKIKWNKFALTWKRKKSKPSHSKSWNQQIFGILAWNNLLSVKHLSSWIVIIVTGIILFTALKIACYFSRHSYIKNHPHPIVEFANKWTGGGRKEGVRDEGLIRVSCSFHTWSFNKAGWHYGSCREGEMEVVRWLRVMNLYSALMISMSNIYLTHSLLLALVAS